jgi:hypothetical protein
MSLITHKQIMNMNFPKIPRNKLLEARMICNHYSYFYDLDNKLNYWDKERLCWDIVE